MKAVTIDLKIWRKVEEVRDGVWNCKCGRYYSPSAIWEHQAVKATNLDNKWLPVICGVLGGILGVVGLYWIPEYPAQEYYYGNCCRYYVWFSSNWCQSGL